VTLSLLAWGTLALPACSTACNRNSDCQAGFVCTTEATCIMAVMDLGDLSEIPDGADLASSDAAVPDGEVLGDGGAGQVDAADDLSTDDAASTDL
jgi:hypothetical protein